MVSSRKKRTATFKSSRNMRKTRRKGMKQIKEKLLTDSLTAHVTHGKKLFKLNANEVQGIFYLYLIFKKYYVIVMLNAISKNS
jgi:hypothetical protein